MSRGYFLLLLFLPTLLWADLTVKSTRCIIPAEVNHGQGKVLQQQFAEARESAISEADNYQTVLESDLFKSTVVDPLAQVNQVLLKLESQEQINAGVDRYSKMLLERDRAVLEAWKNDLLTGKFPEGTNFHIAVQQAFLDATKSIQTGVNAKTMFSAGEDPEKQYAAIIHDDEAFSGQMVATRLAFKDYTHFYRVLEDACPGVPAVSFEVKQAGKKSLYKSCFQVPGTKSAPFPTDAACSYSISCENLSIDGTSIEGVDSMVFGLMCEKTLGSCPDLVGCARQPQSSVGSPSAGQNNQAAPAK